jgi:peptide deformylase
VESDGEPTTDSEGCLSLPGLRYETTRGWHAAVEGVDLHGEPVRAEGTGNFARCLQHETDHLIGKVYVDRLESEARRAAMREVRAAEWSA